MPDPSYTQVVQGKRVLGTITGAHPVHVDYPLLEGDVLQESGVDTHVYTKVAPGLCIEGFVLTPEQEATMLVGDEVTIGVGGLDFFFGDA
jgi:hypothetical protein